MHRSQARETGSPVAVALVRPARNRALALFTAFTLTVAVLVSGAVTAAPAGATSVENTFTNKINRARASHGLPPLTTRAHLVRVARAWAARMASQTRLYHNPRLTSDVSNWRWVGENVGYGPTAATVHVAFMNSPGHRANILDRDYTEVGVGAVVRHGRVWVAEVFRRPQQATSTRSTAGKATFRATLRYGSKGAAVMRVQARLGVKQTGFYGRGTKAAVSRFQKGIGWRGRGNCGPKTWARLF